MNVRALTPLCILLLGATVLGTTAFLGRSKPAPLIVYSGRSEDLIQPLIDQYKQQTGKEVKVRYGQTAELAATILEEGRHSPADVFIAQDAGALGSLAKAGRLSTLPASCTDRVPARFQSPRGEWIGLSGRARVVVYNPERVNERNLPTDVRGFTDPVWRGRVGWAPANGSFQAFVTALRLTMGEALTREWLIDMQANQTRAYPKNVPILLAVAAGEIDVGLVNHYYLYTVEKERGPLPSVRNAVLRDGTMINVAGAGILKTTKHEQAALAFIQYLLSPEAQDYFTRVTHEYPLAIDAPPNPALPPLQDLITPDLDLNRLDDLKGTLQLLMDTGVL